MQGSPHKHVQLGPVSQPTLGLLRDLGILRPAQQSPSLVSRTRRRRQSQMIGYATEWEGMYRPSDAPARLGQIGLHTDTVRLRGGNLYEEGFIEVCCSMRVALVLCRGAIARRCG